MWLVTKIINSTIKVFQNTKKKLSLVIHKKHLEKKNDSMS